MPRSASGEDVPLSAILSALILGADHALTLEELRKTLADIEEQRRAQAESGPDVSDDELEVAQAEADLAAGRTLGAIPHEEAAAALEAARAARPEREHRAAAAPSPAAVFPPADIRKAIEDIRTQLAAAGLGIELVEINGGYRFQTAAPCGPWVRQMLNKGRATVLSRPSIETLAIIAYRQPVTRSEIESVRGVNAGHVIKALMEMQLVRIVGRSDLPGRPFLFGTTPQFLEHFGLKSLSDLETLPGASGDGAAAATPLPQPPVLSTAR